MTNSQTGARPIRLSPSRSRWTRGRPASRNVRISTSASVLLLRHASDGLPDASLKRGDDATDVFITHANDVHRVRGVEHEPVTCAAPNAKGAAFNPQESLAVRLESSKADVLRSEWLTPVIRSIGRVAITVSFFSTTVIFPSAITNLPSRSRCLSPSATDVGIEHQRKYQHRFRPAVQPPAGSCRTWRGTRGRNRVAASRQLPEVRPA